MPDVRANGVKVNYRQTGAGADVVLVHGLAANQAFWGLGLVATLARAFRVTTLDLRGHGYSDMPPTGYTPAEQAGDLCAVLDHLGIEQAHLVGHSFGGLVALALALARPERVHTLTIADSRLRALQPRQAVTERVNWPRIRAALAEQGLSVDENDPYIGLSLFEALASLQGDAAARVLAEEGYVPFGTSKRSAKAWLRLVTTTTLLSDYRAGADFPPEQLARLRMAVLAVYGTDSPTRETGSKLGGVLPNCRTVWVPGARHFHPATHPAFFLETLQGFLRSAGESREGL